MAWIGTASAAQGMEGGAKEAGGLEQRCENTTFYTNMTWAKKNYPKKCVNYDKYNSRQNSVKGPKDPNSAKNAKT